MLLVAAVLVALASASTLHRQADIVDYINSNNVGCVWVRE